MTKTKEKKVNWGIVVGTTVTVLGGIGFVGLIVWASILDAKNAERMAAERAENRRLFRENVNGRLTELEDLFKAETDIGKRDLLKSEITRLIDVKESADSKNYDKLNLLFDTIISSENIKETLESAKERDILLTPPPPEPEYEAWDYNPYYSEKEKASEILEIIDELDKKINSSWDNNERSQLREAKKRYLAQLGR